MLDLYEEVDNLKPVLEEAKFHESHSSLATKNAELLSSLETAKKYPKEATTTAVVMTRHTDKDVKALKKEKES